MLAPSAVVRASLAPASIAQLLAEPVVRATRTDDDRRRPPTAGAVEVTQDAQVSVGLALFAIAAIASLLAAWVTLGSASSRWSAP